MFLSEFCPPSLCSPYTSQSSIIYLLSKLSRHSPALICAATSLKCSQYAERQDPGKLLSIPSAGHSAGWGPADLTGSPCRVLWLRGR